MTTKIRLARARRKKRPYYKVVVADSRCPRDGKFIEEIGHYNPLLNKNDEKRYSFNSDRVNYWLSQGAQPSEKVIKLIEKTEISLPKKIQFKVDIKKKAWKNKAPKYLAKKKQA